MQKVFLLPFSGIKFFCYLCKLIINEKYSDMKKLLFVGLILSFFAVKAQNTGDVCMIGVNSDNPDKALMVTLVNLSGSQVIYFTDNEWNGSAWTSGEGFKVYTAPASGLAAGDVVEINFTNNTASEGSVSSVSGNFNLSSGGDQLYMYFGSDANTPTTFLFAINTKGGWAANEISGTGLTDGTDALTFPNSTDNEKYIGIRNGTITALKSAIADVTNNWQTSTSPFTFDLTDFTISGTSTNSAESDIVKTAGWLEPENIDYTLYQAANGLTTGNSLEVGKFTMRDGGAAANDVDNVATILSAITFQINNYANIRALALFAGGTNVSEVTAISYNTAFSGINALSAPDNDSVVFSVRATFKTTVTDNEHLRFLITSASVDASGSDFAQTNAGGAHTDNSGDKNKIVVQADRLAVSAPTAVNMNTNFPFTVNAVDVNGNLDLDENSTVTLSLSTGTGNLSSASGLTQSLSAGTYSWNDLQYDTPEDIHIEAQSSSLTNAISNTITVNENQNLSLIISEVSDPANGGNAKFVELYNAGNSTIDFSADDWYLSRQSNGSNWGDVKLTGTVAAGETFVVAYQLSAFQNTYGFAADQGSSIINGNGNDGYFLFQGNNHQFGNLMDAYGVIDQDGNGTLWKYKDGHAVRRRDVLNPNPVWDKNEWAVVTKSYGSGSNTYEMTPGRHRTSLSWDGSASTNWSDTANWSTSHVPDFSDLVSIPSAANPPEITRDAMAYDLTIAADMTLTVDAGKYLSVGGNIYNNHGVEGLVLKSNAGGTANLLTNSACEAKVETYISQDEWHMIAPPVIGDTSGVFKDIYLMEYVESDSSWNYIVPLDIGLDNGKSYFAWSSSLTTGNATVANDGTLEVNDVSVNLDYTNPNPHPGGMGWTMLGNPYTSNLTFNSSWSFNNVEQTIYIWDQTAGNYKSVNSAGVGAADTILAVGQGFWMLAQAAGASVQIPASERRTFNKHLIKSNTTKKHQITFSIAGNNYSDEIVLKFDKEASLAFEPSRDARKKRGLAAAPQMYMKEGGIEMTTNVLPFEKGMEIPVNVEIGKDGYYTFSMKNTQIQGDVFLEDLFAKEYINLGQQDYTFRAHKGDDKARFVLHFESPQAVDEPVSGESIHIVADGTNVRISSEKDIEANIAIYDLLGQKLFSGRMQGRTKKVILSQASGYVIVKLFVRDNIFVKKIYLR